MNSQFGIYFSILIVLCLLNPLPIFAKETTQDFQLYFCTVNDQFKFVWFQVPKVASTTIRKILKQNHLLIPKKTFKPTAFQSENFQNYFKFAFVRNPWERVVSCYTQKVANKNKKWEFYYGKCFDKGFNNFVDFIDQQDLAKADRHITLQSLLISQHELDFIGRLENFSNDFQYVLHVIGLRDIIIPKKNATDHKHYSHYYTERTKEIIARKYKKDIEAFGYKFEYDPQ